MVNLLAQDRLSDIIYTALKRKNISFANAFDNLALYHQIIKLADRFGLDVSNKPTIKKGREWKLYMNDITTFLLIGQREKWLSLQMDGNGHSVYWLLNFPGLYEEINQLS